MAKRKTYAELAKRVLELEKVETGLERANAVLRESEGKFRGLVEASSDWIWEVDKDGIYTYANPQIEEILGYKPEEVLGKTPFDFMPLNEAKRIAGVFGTLVKAGEPIITLENISLHKDGRQIILETSGTPVTDATGKVTGYRGVDRDITGRKHAEVALRESEIKHKVLVKNIPGMVYRAYPDWTAEIISGCERISNYTAAELNSKETSWLSIIHPDDKKQIFKEGSLLSMEPSDLIQTYRIIAKGGDVRWVEDRKVSLFSKEGNFLGIDGIVFDITHRKRAEEVLRISHERFLTVLESIDATVYVADMETHEILFMNKNMVESFGKNMVGERCWEAFRGESEPCQECTNSQLVDKKGMPAGVVVWNGKNPITGKWFINHDRAIEWADGRLVRIQIATDITNLKLMEQQVQQSQKFEAIGTLAGGIAHDFNNLLMGIQGRASLLAADLKSHSGMEHTRAIEDYIRSATDLTRQLLGLARGGKYEVKPADLNALLRNSVKMFGRTKKEIRTHTAMDNTPLIVEVDQGQIEQVLLNLYVNAWQAMPGGGELYLTSQSVTLDDYYVEAYNAKPGRYAKASVADTGVGMDDNIQQQLFDPFFTTKEKSRGTGLGLASAYGIIKNHDGIITVNSEVGHGTTFDIYLPLSDKTAHQEAPTSEELINGTEKLLLVDDESMILEVGQAMLAKLGYQVLIADSGQKALEVIHEKGDEIGLIILDLVMPGMEGGIVFDRVKEILPQIPVILSSGYSIDGQANKIMKRGCNGFIQKPFNIATLSKKVREVLDETKISQ